MAKDEQNVETEKLNEDEQKTSRRVEGEKLLIYQREGPPNQIE